jgi:predicted phage tail protein
LFLFYRPLRWAFYIGGINERNMIQIELGGILGKTFGKVHHRLISTTHEATRALAATIPGLKNS